jgi:hypothetical protein
VQLKLELAPNNPGDVEEILNQLCLRLGVALNCLQSALDGRRFQFPGAQQLHPTEHGIERRPQLVGQGCQELVFNPVGCLGFTAGRFTGSPG